MNVRDILPNSESSSGRVRDEISELLGELSVN